MKIYLNKTAQLKIDEIVELVEKELLFNASFSQLEYEILDSEQECNYIENFDEIAGTILLCSINSIAEKDDDARNETM